MSAGGGLWNQYSVDQLDPVYVYYLVLVFIIMDDGEKNGTLTTNKHGGNDNYLVQRELKLKGHTKMIGQTTIRYKGSTGLLDTREDGVFWIVIRDRGGINCCTCV